MIMRIQIRAPHKSIPRETNFDLPDFCILTGINGSGKTHLLEAIADSNKSTVTAYDRQLTNVVHVGFNGLTPPDF
jgi:recombinational DNA repair ATPase RecF